MTTTHRGLRDTGGFSHRDGSGSTPENFLSMLDESARNSGSLKALRIASCRISTRSFGGSTNVVAYVAFKSIRLAIFVSLLANVYG